MPAVKSLSRPYRSPKRAYQAAETRDGVLLAAQQHFLVIGWTKTTIAGIASAAGVSKETVYSVFGSKKAILRELILRAVRGAAPATPLTEQEAPRRIAAEKDQSRQIELFAGDIAEVLARVAPLMDVARVAGGADPAIAALHVQFHRGRRRNLEWVAEALLRNGPLRGGMDVEAAGGILWRLASPELFLLVRRDEGTSQRDYIEWLTTSLKVLLLEGDPDGEQGRGS